MEYHKLLKEVGGVSRMHNVGTCATTCTVNIAAICYPALQATKETYEDENPYHVPPSREEEIYVVLSKQKIKLVATERIEYVHFVCM